MWVPDLGLALRVRPGMTQSSGADCSAPGISPCPFCGGHGRRGPALGAGVVAINVGLRDTSQKLSPGQPHRRRLSPTSRRKALLLALDSE
eukprot:4919308-Prymnesium_polylepis.1